MSAQSQLFQVGAAAFKQQSYLEAIRALEAFCRDHTASPSKDYFQAQVWLIKAYQETGQFARAIALCQPLTVNSPAQIQAWAQRNLPVLINASSTQSVNTRPTLIQTPTRPLEPSVSSEPPAFSAPSVPPTPSKSDAIRTDPPFLTLEESARLLETGNKALKMRRFADAVQTLESYCRSTDPTAKDYPQAQTLLVKAYKGNGQMDEAIALCQQLVNHEKPFIHIWARQFLQTLAPDLVIPPASSSTDASSASPTKVTSTSVSSRAQATPQPEAPQVIPKAGRSPKRNVKLLMKGIAGNLALASTVTLSLLSGMVLVLCLNLRFVNASDNPTLGLLIAISITLLFNAATFVLAPILLDLIQHLLYGTRWVSLSQIERHSPETARIIRTVCQQHKIQQPRLGLIQDQNPTAFTYGSLPSNARLVVSQGLFTYLDDDEVATVYAHELGHIVHWDFAVMTLASTLVQITYLIYTYTKELANKLGDGDGVKQVKNAAQTTTLIAYFFYRAGEYLLLYLSRIREYYADHFAAEVTGNPNGLSRALVKIAYGIVEEGQRTQVPSKVLQGTRALGICDPHSAAFTGTAYRVAAEPQKVGKIFLWDMFNPWGWWMELSSTHPLTGKRVRALTTYAEQLGLDVEFDMARVVREGRTLNKKRLYSNFILDLLLYRAELIGVFLGLAIASWLLVIGFAHGIALLCLGLFGFGVGMLFKTFVMYPSFYRPPAMDVLTLMSDPYASPLRGRPVKLTGEVIGRGDTGNKFGSDLKMKDPTGMIYLRYASRFGPLGNFLFGMTQVESFIRQEVTVVGWFRRGIAPWVDLIQMDCPQKWRVSSYHRFWSFVLGGGAIILSLALPVMLASK
jgi:Zn-dependent protease with chaperone function